VPALKPVAGSGAGLAVAACHAVEEGRLPAAPE
jgi:hypothetical protein